MWTLARREIQKKIQMKMGEKSAELMAQHNSFAMIVSSALGGKPAAAPKVGDTGVRDITAGAATVEDAVAGINAAFRF